MALGEKLRDARLKRRLTPSQVAAVTRMKVQTVEALEREDFSRIAAPIYGRGFIRLYAEYVGLDPAPLLNEYMSRVAPHERSAAHAAAAARGPAAEGAGEVPAEHRQPDLFEQAESRRRVRQPAGPPQQQKPAVPPPEPAPQPPPAPRPPQSPQPPQPGPAGPPVPAADWRALPGRARAACAALVAGSGRLAGQAASKTRALRARLASLDPLHPAISVRLAEWPLKTLSITVSVLLLLVFVASCLSRCMRAPDAAGQGAPRNEALRVALQPAPPQLDLSREATAAPPPAGR